MDMDRTVAIPALIAFAVTLAAGPATIKYMHRLKFGQFIREEGPESHQKKSGTPTMGGVLFLLGLLAGSLFYVRDYPRIIPLLLVTLGFALVGFLDDYIKVVMKRNLGLTALQKILGQLLVSGAFAFYMIRFSGMGTKVYLPFAGQMIDLSWLYGPILIFVLIGTANGSNFTDGLDGLASGVTVVISIFLIALTFHVGGEVHPVIGAMIGCLLGFLCYNAYPAKIFRGDTGSLALGGFVASTAYMLRMPFYIPLIAFIYFIEVISVIIQVAYFKRTRKRIFRMAPIHHHFELGGWPETKVVTIFMIVTAVLGLIGMLAF